MNQIDNTKKAEDSLRQYINQMQRQYEDRLEREQEKQQQELADIQAKLNSQQVELEQERKKQALQAQHIQELAILLDEKKRELMIENDKTTINLQIAGNATSLAENRAKLLTEHKRVLVKEVKSLRVKLDQCNEIITQLKALNDRLNAAMTTMSSNSSSSEAASLSYSALSIDQMLQTMDISNGRADSRSPTNSIASTSKSIVFSPTDGDEQVSDDPPTPSTKEEGASMTWSAPVSQNHLRELEWLSEEQRALVEKRSHHEANTSDSPEQSKPSFSSSYFPPIALLAPAVMSSSSSSTPAPSSSSSTPSSATIHNRKETKRNTLLSMFNGENKPAMVGLLDLEHAHVEGEDENEEDRLTSASASASTSRSHKHPSFDTSIAASSVEDEVDRTPSAMRLHCLRCHGTVEGPKYSTCKCAIPALTPEDLHSSSVTGGSIVGMFSRSAGGLAGGIARRVSTVSGMMIPQGFKESPSSHGSLSSNDQQP
jgi:hypothetical protein